MKHKKNILEFTELIFPGFFLKNLILLITFMFSADVAINYSMPLYFTSNIIPVLSIIHFFVHSFLYVK